MARRRRLNKNLVAALTVTGIILSVVIVAVGTMQWAKKDPEVFVAEAQQIEDKDPGRAIELYAGAYDVNKEVKYLVEAARVAWEAGEIRIALGTLDRAHDERPEEVEALNILLERYWELNTHRPGSVSLELRDRSEDMLRLDQDHVLRWSVGPRPWRPWLSRMPVIPGGPRRPWNAPSSWIPRTQEWPL